MKIAFIKDNAVINIAVFKDTATEETVNAICIANGGELPIDIAPYGEVGIGFTWHGDHFRPPQPYPSWTWDDTQWVAPVPMPSEGLYTWDEATLSWVEIPLPE